MAHRARIAAGTGPAALPVSGQTGSNGIKRDQTGCAKNTGSIALYMISCVFSYPFGIYLDLVVFIEVSVGPRGFIWGHGIFKYRFGRFWVAPVAGCVFAYVGLV